MVKPGDVPVLIQLTANLRHIKTQRISADTVAPQFAGESGQSDHFFPDAFDHALYLTTLDKHLSLFIGEALFGVNDRAETVHSLDPSVGIDVEHYGVSQSVLIWNQTAQIIGEVHR